MPGPLAIGAIGAGLSLFGDLTDDSGMPQYYIDMLRKQAQNQDYSGFLPDESVFMDSAQADIDEFLGSAPFGRESFNTDLASRGIYSSGEAPKHLYNQVYAPIARAGTGAITKAHLGYAQAYQQGSFQEAQLKASYMSMLGNALMSQTPSITSKIGGNIGAIGKMGTQYALLQALGIFDKG